MRKTIISCISLFAILIVACNKIEPVEEANINLDYSVIVDCAMTKTVNNGMSTIWKANDKLSVFHTISGQDNYVKDGVFKIEDPASNEFKGTLNEELLKDQTYDWYLFYPNNSNLSVPNNTTYSREIGCMSTRVQTQDGNNNMSHLAGANFPLYAIIKDNPADKYPSAHMKNVASVIEFEVKNETSRNFQVTSITFSAPSPIIGSFAIDFSEEPLKFSVLGANAVSSDATLNVTNGASIASNQAGLFYIGIKPITIESGEEIAVIVHVTSDGIEDQQMFVLEIEQPLSLLSGNIETFELHYNHIF